MAKNPVRSQMGNRAPSPEGVGSSQKQYNCAPFSKYKHDVGTGGIPTVIEVKTGAKTPTSTAPAFSSPNAATGSPSQSTRRYSK